tara:strand:+ start:635 stop:1390 length:756 start_codon:yes stop_codon:yes gene_type:complete
MKHNYISRKGIAKFDKIQIIWLFIFFGSFFTKIHSQESIINKKPYLETTAVVDTLVVPDRFFLNIKINEALSNGRISTEEVEIKMKSKLESLGLDLENQVALIKVSSTHRRFLLRKAAIYKAKEYSILAFDIETANKIIIELESIGISNIVLNKIEYSNESELRFILREKAMQKALSQAELTALPLNQKIKKAFYISDTNDATAEATSKIISEQRNFGHYAYYVNRYDISLGLKMKSMRVSSSIFVKFDLE